MSSRDSLLQVYSLYGLLRLRFELYTGYQKSLGMVNLLLLSRTISNPKSCKLDMEQNHRPVDIVPITLPNMIFPLYH